jgi:hypothetical protein
MLIKATVGSTIYTIGVVEGFDIQLGYEGGAEPYYGSRIRKHSAGSKTITFSLTRWYYTDATQENLLFTLFQNEIEFDLEGDLITNQGVPIGGGETSNAVIEINDARLYKWRPRTGKADDIIGEEASGQATDWTVTIVDTGGE